MTAKGNASSMNNLPDLLKSPNVNRPSSVGECTIVAFDIEGTGLLHEKGQMVQLSAIYRGKDGTEHQLDKYILPTRNFAPEAARITGFKLRDDVLYKQGQAVTTVSLKDCLKSFIEWLGEVPGTPILMAHNCIGYDAPLLCASLENNSLFEGFHKAVGEGGFGDSLPVMRDVYAYPEIKKHGLADLKAALLRGNGRKYDAHDGLGDALALFDLLELKRVKLCNILTHSKQLHASYGRYCIQFIENVTDNRPSLDGINVGLSNIVKTTISGAGYNLEYLKRIANKSGMEGIRQLIEDKLGLKKCDRAVRILYQNVSKGTDRRN